MYSIGIDFGTSNSSVAIFDGQTTRLLPLDPAASNPEVMRSLLYIPRDGEIVAGQRALDLYTEQNTGREVIMERRYLRAITMTFSDMSVTKDAYAMVDVNEPGRLFQSLKRFLPVTSFQKTNVFGREYRLEELVATLAKQMVRAAESALVDRIDRLTIGRPVRFSEDPDKNEAARRRLEEAWRQVGVREIRFVEEPVAAAYHYASEERLAPGVRFLVFDFGGGTLDVTVARAGQPAIEVLATGGVPIGGDLMDSRIMETHVAEHLGKGAHYREGNLPVPNHIFSRLKSWQTIVELNRPDRMELIRQARRTADKPRELAALEHLVSRNHGLDMFRAIELAKIDLSSAEIGTVRLKRGAIDVREDVTRSEFEAAIAAQLLQARACVLDAVERAGCEPEEITLVITTGGSSLIPAFRRTLEEALPRATLAATGTFTSVAAGLALAGAA
ncbi:MAG: Hsp70 family protein [Chloroflexi bacterium]|nr:Hsp70 family protein [Chloroflexota bacterium]